MVSRHLRRQTVGSNVLLTVYINPNNPSAADKSPNPNLKLDYPTPSYVSDPASSLSSETPDVANSAILSDAPTATEVAAVPGPIIIGLAAPALTTESILVASNGDVISSIPTATNYQSSLVPTAISSATTTYPSNGTTTSCVGSYCYNTYKFEAYDGIPSPEDVVFVPKPCDCLGGWGYQPIAYKDALDSKVTVYL